MTVKKGLNTNQRKAIAALLEYKTVKDAAVACGLSEKTLHRYMKIPLFSSTLAQLENEMVRDAGRILAAGQKVALDTLMDLMENALKEDTQRLAAKAWMDFCLRWREVKVQERLAKLEQAVFEEGKQNVKNR